MAKPELGTKRVCVSCSTRFYDLQKVPAVCPKCGTEQPLDQPRVRRSTGNVTAEDRRPKKVAAVDPDEADAEVESDADADESEADDAVEDTDDLDDDADVIGTDIEVETDDNDREH